jgi:hypothetical protein
MGVDRGAMGREAQITHDTFAESSCPPVVGEEEQTPAEMPS